MEQRLKNNCYRLNATKNGKNREWKFRQNGKLIFIKLLKTKKKKFEAFFPNILGKTTNDEISQNYIKKENANFFAQKIKSSSSLQKD